MRRPLLIAGAALGALLTLPLLVLLVVSSTPQLAWQGAAPLVIGTETPVAVQVNEPHGVRRLTAYLEQNGQRYPVHTTQQPATRLLFWRRHDAARTITIPVGTKAAAAVKDGPARVVIEAQANDLRGSTTSLIQPVTINTQPPGVVADGAQHYINQGGSELVVFTASGYWTEAGVRVGKYTFRSFPLPGQPDQPGAPSQRFALFAYPWDLPPDIAPVVYVRNPTGAEAKAQFWFKLFPKRFRTRELDLSDAFLQKVATELDPQGSGDLVTRFVRVNSALRTVNNQVLAGLRLQTQPRVLWSGPFQQLGNSKVEAQFADERTYAYRGRKVDQQMHLGFDLSVTKNVPVVASNSGQVIWAAPLGIYGNCVVVDHGYGLQSIYGHLSRFTAKAGQAVGKGQELGRSGATGLAGGDHLHYSMQVDGVQVNPVEWWDAHWIHDRILSKLPVAQH